MLEPIAHEHATSLSMPMPCTVRNSPGAYPVFPHALMNFPSFEYFDDAVVGAVSIRDEDIAVGRRHDARRGPEMIFIAAGDARLARASSALSRPG